VHQRGVLAHQRVRRLGQDAHQIVPGEGGELHADREAPLELGNQVRRLGDVERARGDEEDVVGRHRSMLGLDRRALDDRQQIALHALARDVRPLLAPAPRGDLVDLVHEDDARLLDALDRLLAHVVHVDETERLLGDQGAACVGDLHAPLLLALREHAPEQVLELNAHLFDTLRCHDGHRRPAPLLAELDVDLAIVELAEPQQAAQLLAGLALGLLADGLGRAGDRGRREQRVEDALLGALLGLGGHPLLLLLGHHRDRELGQIANDRLDVATHVADLGELRRLDLDEGRLRELREAARDLGLPHTGRADHDDVLRRDLVAQLRGHLLASPTVAQRDRDGALGLALTDDVAVELRDDLAGGEGG
jgi:hypothetical protein